METQLLPTPCTKGVSVTLSSTGLPLTPSSCIRCCPSLLGDHLPTSLPAVVVIQDHIFVLFCFCFFGVRYFNWVQSHVGPVDIS